MNISRFIIGIDLGTTNSAVTYIDTYDEKLEPKTFYIPQIVAPGEVASNRLLPSFCYIIDDYTISKESIKLPWESNGKNYTIGIFARDFGSNNPNRFISSVKSWLCHGGIDRKKRILPWNSDVEEIKVSPVEVTSYILNHIREAWNHKFAKVKDIDNNSCNIETQEVIITVPASFDEIARELTIEAAKRSGLKNIKLLEEPIAAFYSFLNKKDCKSDGSINPGDKILIIDVGGGTTDLSIIEVKSDMTISRLTAGEHLLLGGDNIDIAIAKNIEKNWKRKLSYGPWVTLCQKSREAKERILNSNLESFDVILLSKGSAVIGGSRKSTVTREELLELIKNSFFNELDPYEELRINEDKCKKVGLPYVFELSVTRHLLEFLRNSCRTIENLEGEYACIGDILYTNKVLFNGGTVIPKIIRERVLANLKIWFVDRDVEELKSDNFRMAVAFGASYYGLACRGDGVKIRSGTTVSYYLKVAKKENGEGSFICIMPRGTDENKVQNIGREFILKANKKVLFPLYSSAVRLGDKTGDLINSDENLRFITNLTTVMKFGKIERDRQVKASIESTLTETGLLKVYVKSLESNHRWTLNFDVRLIRERMEIDYNNITVDTSYIDNGIAIIKEYFRATDREFNLLKELEKTLELKRSKWPIYLLRKFADMLLDIDYSRLISNRKKARYLNLLSYVLRPGFGDSEDVIRIKKLWQLWYKGVGSKSPEVLSNWWLLWRRIASGLGNGHQRTIFQSISKILYSKKDYKKFIKDGVQVKAELWRCNGALEKLNLSNKQMVGKILIDNLDKLEGYEFWALGRIGNRILFHAPENYIIPANIVEKWITALIETECQNKFLREKMFALTLLARKSENRSLDISEELSKRVVNFLEENDAYPSWVDGIKRYRPFNSEEEKEIIGDSIPLGLEIRKS